MHQAAPPTQPFAFALHAESFCIRGEFAESLTALRASLRAEHQPATLTEEILVNDLAEQFWRIRRARDFEALALEDSESRQLFAAQLPFMLRIGAAAERGFDRSLKTLRQLQAARLGKPQPTKRNQPQSASLAQADGFVPAKTPQAAAGPGFVPSNPAATDSSRNVESCPPDKFEPLLPPHRNAA